MLDYGFTEEQTAIRDLARAIADNEIRPVAADYDQSGEFPWPIVHKLAEADLYGVFVDEAYGGIAGGSRTLNMVLVTEELSKACGGVALAFAGSALGALPIILGGSEEQKQRFLPDVAAGTKLAAFALTEPQAGSDAAGIRMTAVRDGDDYVLNGTKIWITGGGRRSSTPSSCSRTRQRGRAARASSSSRKAHPDFRSGRKKTRWESARRRRGSSSSRTAACRPRT